MTTYPLETKKKFELTARSIAILFGVTFLVLFFWNLLNYQDPKPSEFGSIVIINNSGEVQNEQTAVASPAKEKEEIAKAPKNTNSKKEKTKKTKIKKDVVKDDRSKKIPIEEEGSVEEEKDLNKKAKEDAEKQAGADQIRDGIKDAFDNGKDKTKENDKEGEGPAKSNLNGLSSGAGMVGGSLGDRGGTGPKINDQSQATGIVVVKVCVDENGKVLSAKFTQSGSTTTDSQLRSLAENNAKLWSFKKGGIDKQCGTITYEFKVK